jgi:hypothetical protein
MSAIYPAFEKPLVGSDSFNGNSLSRCLSQLDELAASVKVTALSRLIDVATMADELDDEDIGAIAVPPVKWFQAADGLLTIRGLLVAAEQNNVRFQSRRGDDTETVLAELKQLEELLVAAAADANRFHLLVDM